MNTHNTTTSDDNRFEVELKEEKKIEGTWFCLMCAKPATRTVVIGKVENDYGDDYELCDDEQCLENAMDDLLDEYKHMKSRRKQLTEMENWGFK